MKHPLCNDTPTVWHDPVFGDTVSASVNDYRHHGGAKPPAAEFRRHCAHVWTTFSRVEPGADKSSFDSHRVGSICLHCGAAQ